MPTVLWRLDQGSGLFQTFLHEVLLHDCSLRIEAFTSGGDREAPGTQGTMSGERKPASKQLLGTEIPTPELKGGALSDSRCL